MTAALNKHVAIFIVPQSVDSSGNVKLTFYDTSVGETASSGGTTTRMNVNKAGFEKESLAAYFTPPAGYEECRKITLGDAEVFFHADDVSTFAWYAK